MGDILVTGASGFIGSHLVPRLAELGHSINIEFGDVTDESTWFKVSKYQTLIHLAGKTYVPDSWENPFDYFKCNLLGTIAALNYCREHNVNMIFISSYLYGNSTIVPVNERCELIATNPYALSKKMAEETCQFFSESYDMNVIVLRLFNVYGPGQSINFLIPSIINQINSNDSIHVDDLEPKRDYIYINDVVDAIIKSINNKSGFNSFNIGSGVSYSVNELIQIIQEIKQTKYTVHSRNKRRKDEIMDTIADINRANKILKWEPKYTLHDGLKEMVELYKN